MEGAAKAAEYNIPDLVDINFGCPVYKVVNKDAGAACLRDLGMKERMAGTVVDAVATKPVTLKTRLGSDAIVSQCNYLAKRSLNSKFSVVNPISKFRLITICCISRNINHHRIHYHLRSNPPNYPMALSF
tara:strand:- start:30 stop:419 length:390 start_codon:yes stop_codon:yes gene_type:complete